MKFKFDPNQDYQLEAIAAVVDLFEGHAKTEEAFTLDHVGIRANPLSIDWEQVRENLRRVQERNGLPPDEDLAYLEGQVEVAGGEQVKVRFPNFTVEMETGTGKTYVYLRTALELFTRYGFRKFIVVVPSVAIREGVLKTLQITEHHFRELYQNPPLRYYTYDSGQLSQVRSFAQSDGLEIMVMTIQSFQGEHTVLRQERDQLQGTKPIHLLQATRPVLILDEPQNMESEDRIRALADLAPLFALRYSATHRNPYNLVYRLTPLEAYRRGLVKKIEVAGLVETGSSRCYIRVENIRREKKRLTATLTLQKLLKKGNMKLAAVKVKPGDLLETKTNNPLYRDYQVDEIGEGYVRFTNGLEVALGQAVGPDKEAVFRAQIRYTIETHFIKQRRLKPLGIKVLSLFFLDRVASYIGENGEEGLVRRLFREEFEVVRSKNPDWEELLPSWKGKSPDDLQAAYFATKQKKNGMSYFEEETSKEAREAFQRAYELIMRDKERLLSFEEPVAFIFTHSALREGWDNPNVFQICTLNQSVSMVKKRQEIGRGIRLCVNQRGERVFDRLPNVLTVVANESYAEYVARLQSEYQEDGVDAPRVSEAPRDPKERPRGIYRRTKDLTDPRFVELWDRIKHRTRYRVSLDSNRLVEDVVAELGKVSLIAPRIEVTKALVDVDGEGLVSRQVASPKPYIETSKPPIPNLLELVSELLRRTSPPVRITRRTLFEILRRTKNQKAMLCDPQGFATALVRILKEKLADQLVEGIRYEKTGTWWEASQIFKEEFMAYLDRLKRDSGGKPLGKSMYEAVEYESQPESDFVDQLEADPEVVFYVKLPPDFKVPTPLGNYNPDWAVLLEERDVHGNPTGQKLYLVQETKDTSNIYELDTEERRKVLCGKAHFETLGVCYKVGPKLRE